MKKNILFIVGSLRKGSFNLALARTAEAFVGDKAAVTYLDYNDLPFVNQDIEFPAPAPVARLRDTVAAADAIWVFMPEYNGSYPAQLKNLFDWLSRPVVAGDYTTPTVIRGKKATISGAGGNSGTANGREKLAELLTLIGADLMPEGQTGIVLNMEAWTEDKMMLTEEQLRMLEKQTETFLHFIT